MCNAINQIPDPIHAFPQHGWTSNPTIREEMKRSGMGMTLRDYFAAQALTGILAGVSERCSDGTPDVLADKVTKCAYKLADAMCAARAEGGAA